MADKPCFEVFPERTDDDGLTGEFVWHFQDANGELTHDGGESFTRREDAHRSIEGVAYDYAILFGHTPAAAKVLAEKLPIVDLDADGEPITPEGPDQVIQTLRGPAE